MTKKDYQLIAGTIREACPMSNRVQLSLAFCQRLKKDNDRFDPVRFLVAATSLNESEARRCVTIADLV